MSRYTSAGVSCDLKGCCACEEDLGTIGELLPKVKAEGWRVRKIGGRCWDLCPEHADKPVRVVQTKSQFHEGTYDELALAIP